MSCDIVPGFGKLKSRKSESLNPFDYQNMKINSKQLQNPNLRLPMAVTRQRTYWTAIALASLACRGIANAQATNASTSTNAPAASTTVSASSTNVTQLQETTVTAGADETSRDQILPDLGTSAYGINSAQITAIPGGQNAPISQVLLRAPGVAQDSAVNGDLHVRGEHGNLQYRINDVLLPEGVGGFGVGVDTRFVDSMKLITGALPAEYGYRTAGVVDIQTKAGGFVNGGEADLYGGSHNTIQPSVEYGGSVSNFSYFVEGKYFHTSLGIENPAPTHEAIHDISNQGNFFSYMSYTLDDTSRLSLMLSAIDNQFQVPNLPGNEAPPAAFPGAPGQPATFDSANLDENQNEQNYFAALTYMKTLGDMNLQVSGIGRRSSVHFVPDPVGDLFYFGEASDVQRTLDSGGLQADITDALNENHTLRGGVLFLGQSAQDNSTTTVYNFSGGAPSGMPFPIASNTSLYGYFTGLYLQDEWKIVPKLTLNYGARFDVFNSSFDNEHQFSPRANFVFKPWDTTTLHAGYARYFTPPQIELVPGGVTQFAGTTGVATNQIFANDPVRCERANYYDVGISQQIITNLTVGVDGYYKQAKNQLDDGLFGQTLIESAFNYENGITEGVEFTANYTTGGFSTYANVAIGTALGTRINSAQYLFTPEQLDYINAGNYVHLDHLQTVSGSFGVSYLWQESSNRSLLTYADAIFGSGLRTDLTTPNGVVPNGATLPNYYTLNLGAEQRFKLGEKKSLKARLDLVNITDVSYALRNGAGVGVGAPQYGQRRSFYATIGFAF